MIIYLWIIALIVAFGYKQLSKKIQKDEYDKHINQWNFTRETACPPKDEAKEA